MATCPQCRHRFRFRDHRADAAGSNPARTPPEPPAAGPEEDDPLPPGAITPGGWEQHAKETPETPNSADKEYPPPHPETAHAQSQAEDRQSLFTGSGASGLAWESEPLARLPVALYQTIRQVLFAAPDFFIRVGASGASLLRPCVFYVLLGAAQNLAQRFWLLSRLSELASMQDPKMQATLDTMTQNLNLPMLLISMPPVLLVTLVFYAGLFNLMIRLVQPDRANFSTILRVVAYSAAPGILCVVPVVGFYVASIWFAFCCFTGCKYALNLEWKRTAMAILPLYALFVAFSLHANKMLMDLAQ
jgi:hypothetical protein